LRIIGATVHPGERTGPNFGPLYNDGPAAGSHHSSMEATTRKVLALGGHDFTSSPADRAVSELIQRTAAARARGRPRICILPSADEDTAGQVSRFHAAFGDRPCDASDVSLFRFGERPAELCDHLLNQDLIYVAGGSLPTLMAQWEQHGVGEILRLAWRQGTVLAGQDAGAMCWFETGITTSAGTSHRPAGLSLLPGSLCVRYDSDPERRAGYLDAVSDGMPDGYGIDDHAVLLWEGTAAPMALTAQRGCRAYRVATDASGGAVESPLPARFLPAPAPAALREDIAEYRRITAMRKRAGWLG
jgi:peptidase E